MKSCFHKLNISSLKPTKVRVDIVSDKIIDMQCKQLLMTVPQWQVGHTSRCPFLCRGTQTRASSNNSSNKSIDHYTRN